MQELKTQLKYMWTFFMVDVKLYFRPLTWLLGRLRNIITRK